MRIDYQTIHQGDDDGDGCIHFEMGNYVYFIGEMDGESVYIERQLIEDHDNNMDNWEQPEWVPSKEKRIDFKFLKNYK
jgi:hypothetical protein